MVTGIQGQSGQGASAAPRRGEEQTQAGEQIQGAAVAPIRSIFTERRER
jgi:hypothetical protein